MVSKLPDEFFRRRPEQPEVVEEASPAPVRPQTRVLPPDLEPPSKVMLVPTRVAAVLVFLALLAGFLAGRALLDRPEPIVRPTVQPSAVTTTPTTTPTENLTLYDGPTTTIRPLDGDASCMEEDVMNVLDSRAGRIWSCQGDGVGETLRFGFRPGQELVGLRIVGGNDTSLEEFAAGRRILSVRWRFPDGSWFEQGLPSDDATAQEVSFPPVRADFVELEILSSTEPGEPTQAGADLVSISLLQFVAPA